MQFSKRPNALMPSGSHFRVSDERHAGSLEAGVEVHHVRGQIGDGVLPGQRLDHDRLGRFGRFARPRWSGGFWREGVDASVAGERLAAVDSDAARSA